MTRGVREQPAALCISSLISQIPLLLYQQDHYPLSSLPSLHRLGLDVAHQNIAIHTHLTHSHSARMLIILRVYRKKTVRALGNRKDTSLFIFFFFFIFLYFFLY